MIDYSKIATEYSMFRGTCPPVLTKLVSQSNLSNDSKVLEVGCGCGNYIGKLRSLTNCEGYGVDRSPDMLTIARKNFSSIDFRMGRAEKLGFANNSFDLVFSVDVIHQIAERRTYFEEAFRVLRDGGKVCTVTDSEWIIRNRMPQSFYFPSSIDIELARYPKDGELRQIMEAVGLHDYS